MQNEYRPHTKAGRTAAALVAVVVSTIIMGAVVFGLTGFQVLEGNLQADAGSWTRTV